MQNEVLFGVFFMSYVEEYDNRNTPDFMAHQTKSVVRPLGIEAKDIIHICILNTIDTR